MRGIGSARTGEVDDAMAYAAEIISAYKMHVIGMDAVLDRIPDSGPYYLTIDADGIDPTIMPAVMAQTPGGLSWVQIRKLIHGLVNKGRVLGMDLVEIAPMHDLGNITMIHAERLICNFIGASVRAGYYGRYRTYSGRSRTGSEPARSVEFRRKRFVSFLSLSGRGKRRVTR